MEILQTIALLCQLNGAGSDSATIIQYVAKRQLECQQYFINCVNPINANYKTLSKCVQDRKL